MVAVEPTAQPRDGGGAVSQHASAATVDVEALAQRVGAVLWPSFFSAAVSTMVFFAIVDPLQLRDMTFPHLAMSRGLGYSIGFFLFWIATAASSLFTWILLRPAARLQRTLPPER